MDFSFDFPTSLPSFSSSSSSPVPPCGSRDCDLLTACCDCHDECFDYFIERGDDVNQKNIDNNTPLHMVASFSKAKYMSVLIEKGADIHARNSSGCTPLHLASLFRNKECIDLLLEAGSNVNAVNKFGKKTYDVNNQEVSKHIREYQDLPV